MKVLSLIMLLSSVLFVQVAYAQDDHANDHVQSSSKPAPNSGQDDYSSSSGTTNSAPSSVQK